MRINIDLNEDLNIRIFSFPMRYQPTDMKDRSHIGKNWNRYLLRSMQIILQATHGVVSGAPSFFNKAFDKTEDEFHDLLIRPHHFIFNRRWYEEFGGRAEYQEYDSEFRALGATDRSDLISVLAQFENRHFASIKRRIANKRVARLFRFYKPLRDPEETAIWRRQKEWLQQPLLIPDDERVEDAGLELDAVLN
jgi:hypothetical protein